MVVKEPVRSGSSTHKTELIVALDYATAEKAEACISALGELPVIYKVGLELFTAAGPAWVAKQTSAGRRVFLDLKFHDIPNTVAKASSSISKLGVEMFTIHLSGGARMLAAVRDEFKALKNPPRILGVTVLTSFEVKDWADLTHGSFGGSYSVTESVMGLIQTSQVGKSSLSEGIVCSAHELNEIRKKHPGLYTVVPGIRPVHCFSNDQARVMTPKEAAQNGASAIVVGRPITQAENIKKAAEEILAELS